MKLYDISQTLHPNLAVFPGDAPIRIETTLSMERGDPVTVSAISGSAHAGTHADLPAHVSLSGTSIPLSAYYGDAVVIEASNWPNVLKRFAPRGTRILFKTRDQIEPAQEFDSEFSHMPPEVADWVIASEAILVGVDVPSVDAPDSVTLENHHRLVAANIAILENLDLSAIAPGEYTLAAFPVKTAAPDAAWVRAVLISDEQEDL